MGVLALSVFLLDFFIKGYLKDNLAFHSIPLIKNFLHITVVFNTGAAFGILQGYTTLLMYIGIIFILTLFIMIGKDKKRGTLDNVSFGLILGGALSNLYDRIVFGFVVDYIDIRIWPVFNISDMCISIGVIILIIKLLRKDEAKRACV